MSTFKWFYQILYLISLRPMSLLLLDFTNCVMRMSPPPPSASGIPLNGPASGIPLNGPASEIPLKFELESRILID